MNECPWCYSGMEREGETCDADCYRSYYAWSAAEHNRLNDDLLILEPEDTPPLPLEEQPWYDHEIQLEDYLT